MGDIAPISTIDVPATTKPWVTGDITARRYIEVWSDTILELVFKTIAPVAPHPHPRLRWTVPNDVPSRLQTWAKLELERFGGSAEESVRRILFPLDLLALVDTYRNTQPPPSGQERGDLVGSGAWETTLGEALAAEARPSVLASIRRMGERYVAAADALFVARHVRDPRKEIKALVRSTPIDHIIWMLLGDPEQVQYVAPGSTAAPEQPPRELRAVTLEYPGARDASLWNCVRAISPADASAEEIAAVLFAAPNDANGAHTYNADILIAAPPYFVVPPSWARGKQLLAQFEPDASKREGKRLHYSSSAIASGLVEDHPDDAFQAMAASPLAVEAALAQSEVIGGPSASPPTLSRDQTTTLIDRGLSQLEWMREVLTPWALAETLGPAHVFLYRARGVVVEQAAPTPTWAGLLQRHGELLAQIAEDLAQLVAGPAKTAPSDHAGGGPVGDVLAAYARAAAVAHLVGAGPAQLDRARARSRRLALAGVELAIQSASAAVLRQHAIEDYANANYHPVGPDSAGVHVGGEAQRERIPRGNEAIAATSYVLRGPAGGRLDLSGTPHAEWSTQLQQFLTAELRAQPGRVQVTPLASDPRGETFAVTIGVERLGRLRITDAAGAQHEQQVLTQLGETDLGKMRAAQARGTTTAGKDRGAVLAHGGVTIDELAAALRMATDPKERANLNAQLPAAVTRVAEGLAHLHAQHRGAPLSRGQKLAEILAGREQLERPGIQAELGRDYGAVVARFDALAEQYLASEVWATATHGRAESSSMGLGGYDTTRGRFADLAVDNVRDTSLAARGAGERDVAQFLESLEHTGLAPDAIRDYRKQFLDAYRDELDSSRPADPAAGRVLSFYELRARLARLAKGDRSVVSALIGERP